VLISGIERFRDSIASIGVLNALPDVKTSGSGGDKPTEVG